MSKPQYYYQSQPQSHSSSVYCVSCGIQKNNHWMVNHLFYSNLEYKDISGDKTLCAICAQKEVNHKGLLHPFKHIKTKYVSIKQDYT